MRLLGFFCMQKFISALKTEPKPLVFEKYAKNLKKYLISLFSIFMNFSKIFKQKLLIPTESCFLDGKESTIPKLGDINFLADSVKIA